MSPDRRSAGGMLLAGVLLPLLAHAQGAAGITRVCWSDLVSKPQHFIDDVPVGCDLPGCCPGCPRADALDWRIRVSGDAIEAVAISFADLPEMNAGQLQLNGSVQRESGGELRVTNGTGSIRAIPLPNADSPPIATLTLALNSDFKPRRGAANRAGILIEQMLGRAVVSEYELTYAIQDCTAQAGSAESADRIKLTNNIAGDSAVILMKALRPAPTACVALEDARATGVANVGDVMSSTAACRSYVAVFSDDNAVSFKPEVTTWTNNPGDELTVPLDGRIIVPVKVWVMNPTVWAEHGDPDKFLPSSAIGVANAKYNSNHVGIGFDATYADATNHAQLVGTDNCLSANWPELETQLLEPNKLNVFYVQSQFTGITCDPPHHNVIIIGTDSSTTTLAHEFGHAFSLEHPPQNSTLPPGNIMRDQAARDHLSEGQAFRMSVQCTSMINLMKNPDGSDTLRPGGERRERCAEPDPMVTCPSNPQPAPMACPPLDHDVKPN